MGRRLRAARQRRRRCSATPCTTATGGPRASWSASSPRVPARELYERTGIQLLPVQHDLPARRSSSTAGGRALEAADRMLLVPDLLHFWLSGVAVCERTNASTTQCLDPRTGAWTTDLLERLGIPAAPFRELVEPAPCSAALRNDVAERTGPRRHAVVAVPGTHDTASAVAAVPFRDPRRRLHQCRQLVARRRRARRAADHRRGLRRQPDERGRRRRHDAAAPERRRPLAAARVPQGTWAAEGRTWTFEELTAAAEAAPPLQSFIEPNDPRFLAPGDLPARIRAFCAETGQPEPAGAGEITRCILESLALKHAQTVRMLAAVTGSRPPEIHIVGGGALNGRSAAGRRMPPGCPCSSALSRRPRSATSSARQSRSASSARSRRRERSCAPRSSRTSTSRRRPPRGWRRRSASTASASRTGHARAQLA